MRCVFWGMFCCLLFYAIPVKANDIEKNWSLTVGGAGVTAPEYEGGDSYETMPVPYADGHLSLSEDARLFVKGMSAGGVYALGDNIRLGVVSKYHAKRDSSDSVDLQGMDDIEDAIELGPYFAVDLARDTRLKLQTFFDISNTHDGWIADLSISHKKDIKDTYISLSFAASLQYASEEYNNTYFGVKTSEATASRPAYDSGSGIHSVGVSIGASYAFNPKYTGFLKLGATQLLGDVADSPIVKDETQLMSVIGVKYSF